MMNKFAELTAFIPKIKDSSTFGEWIINRESKGTMEDAITMPYTSYSELVISFMETLYAYCEAHPEFDYTNYSKTLERLGVELSSESMVEADVSSMNAKGVIALLIGATRADHFCEGALLSFFEKGCILRWLERLSEIDKQ